MRVQSSASARHFSGKLVVTFVGTVVGGVLYHRFQLGVLNLFCLSTHLTPDTHTPVSCPLFFSCSCVGVSSDRHLDE